MSLPTEMTREEFILRLTAVERRTGSILPRILFSLKSTVVILFILAVVLVGPSVLSKHWPVAALFILGPSVLIYGSLEFASWVHWDRWIKRLGMLCPSCKRYLFGHSLDSRNYATYGCTKCEESVTGHCGSIGETGLCDYCGQRIFDM